MTNEKDRGTSTTLRVRFAETDQMRIAHHSAYIWWCEVARVEWLRQHGMEYRAWEEAGVSLGVSAINLEYRQPALFDDVVTVYATLRTLRSRRVVFAYEIMRENVVLARGETVHTPMNRQGQAMRLPQEWLEPLQAWCTS